MRYALPTDDGKTLGTVFGRAKSFAIYDDGTGVFTQIVNEGVGMEHGAGTGAVSLLGRQGVGVVVAPELGPKAAQALQAGGIRYIKAAAGMALEAALPPEAQATAGR